MGERKKRAKLVARDGEVAEQVRGYLEQMEYTVEVAPEVEPGRPVDADVVVYHVSSQAAREERRRSARDSGTGPRTTPGFWLDAVRTLCERAPAAPLLVLAPDGFDLADRALDSGATDVLYGRVTPKLFRRRLEMASAYARRPRRRPPPPLLDVPLPTLRSPASGRIDARRVADYLHVPLRRLADAMDLPYAGLHKTPDSPRVQPWLQTVAHVLELADAALGSEDQVRIWLNRPLPELEDESPLAVILAGEAGAVETLLENARAGIPG